MRSTRSQTKKKTSDRSAGRRVTDTGSQRQDVNEFLDGVATILLTS